MPLPPPHAAPEGSEQEAPAQAPSTPAGNTPAPPVRRRFRTFLLFGLLLCVAGWLGATLALPPTVVRSALQHWLSDALNAPVSVETITLHPLTLRATLSGVRLPTRNGDPLLSIQTIELVPGLRLSRPRHADGKGDAWWSRLAALRPQVVVSLRVTRPELDIAYLGDGVFSFSDLLPPDSASGAEQSPKPDPERGETLPLFLLSDFKIVDGTLILRDQPLGSRHVLSEIRFDVPFLIPDSPGDHGEQEDEEDLPRLAAPTLSARLDGTPVRAAGSIQPVGDTLRTSFDIRAGRLELARFADALSRFTPLKLVSGAVEPALTIVVSQPRQGDVDVTLAGRVSLEDVELAAPSGATAGRLKYGRIDLGGFTLNERRVSLRSVELNGLELTVKRDKNGRVDWQDWIAGPEADGKSGASTKAEEGRKQANAPLPSAQTAPATPLVVEGADLILRDSRFVWEDATLSGAGRISVTGVDGRIAEYSTRAGARTAMRLSFGIDDEGVFALEGEGTINPPALQASLLARDFAVAGLRPFLGGTPLSDVAGRLDFEGRFEATDAKGVRVQAENASLRALSLSRSAGKNAALSAEACLAKGLALDTATRMVSLDALRITAPSLPIAIGADGLSLALPTQGGNLAGGPSWQARVGALTVEKGRVFRVASPRAAQNAAVPLIADFSLNATDLTLDPAHTTAFTLKTRGTRNDLLDISGSVRPQPLKLDARIKASGLALDTLGAFLRPWTDATLAGRAEGDIRLEVEDRRSDGAKTRGTSGVGLSGADVSVAGDLTLRDVSVADGTARKNLLRFRRLSAGGLRYAARGSGTAAPVLEAEEIVLDRLNLPLILNKEGRLALLASLRATGSKDAGSKAGAKTATAARNPRNPFSRLRVAKATVRDARLLLSDQRVTPPVTVGVRGLDAELSGLSAKPGTSARITLSAQLDGAPVRLSGTFNALVSPPTADLTLAADDVDLSRYSAYARAYIGYPVEQGRLNLNSVIKTSRQDFSADSEIILRQLVLGPKDAASGAPEYPVLAGLSLLSDFNGDINLKIPLRGSLDNVSLQTGGIVGKALAGLFTKVLTSPISLLSGLFSFLGEDDPELHFITFAPGSATPFPAARRRIDQTAELLRQRPKVKARLVGLYEPASDTAGLKHAGMAQRLEKLRQARPPAGTSAGDPARMAPEEYEELLFLAFKEARRNARADKAAEPIRREHPDVMERELEALIPVGQADLEKLAVARATAVRARLLEIDPALASRVTLATERDGRPLIRSGAARVEMELR